MDGFWFFWVFWLIIIATAFFDDNVKRKEIKLFFCFALIISSMITITLPAVAIRLSFLLAALLTYYYLPKASKRNMVYSFCLSGLLSGVYLLFHYFVYFEPVWLYLSPTTMISSLSFVIVIVLINNHVRRIAVMAAGMLQGEIILAFLLYERYHPILDTYIIGNYAFLDIASIGLLLVLCWNGIEKLMNYVKIEWYQRRLRAQASHKKLNA
ncbi:hypothetical protein SAMN05421736_10424 [Evansella caseinilytica]|uniref:Uncharacterized protein n=1 Tax=Evansella caseinilytica TaxID=1503961 RepID=A0A1H3NC95_9BACI|nr:hypothetical protein [Evansella caseinilytica]SDY86488.1 hypothetical protein SAMN05421736_10424 [Evansella caseinilytica]